MNKPPFNPDLNGFKTVTTREALEQFHVAKLSIKHIESSEDGCANAYTYSKNGEVMAIELAQVSAVSEWWVKETANA